MGFKKPSYLSSSLLLAGALVLGACVTINVYFPAAEAQEAADRKAEAAAPAVPPATVPAPATPVAPVAPAAAGSQ